MIRTMRQALVAFLVGATVSWLGLAAAAQEAETFRARLSPVPVDAATAGAITGSGAVTAVLSGTKLTITGTFEGLRTPATSARLHGGLKGVRGPAFFDLTISKATRGTIGGTLALTATQVEDLRTGRFYVQVHSEKAPDGNLWGWLLK